MPDIGDGPIQPEYQEMMIEVARAIDRFFNGDTKLAARSVGFVLLVFPFGEAGGRCNYISNGADRRDVAMLLQEQLNRFKAQFAKEDKPN